MNFETHKNITYMYKHTMQSECSSVYSIQAYLNGIAVQFQAPHTKLCFGFWVLVYITQKLPHSNLPVLWCYTGMDGYIL